MITKKVMIEFAKPDVKACNHFYDIRRAAKNAADNLASRHDVFVVEIFIDAGNNVIITLRMPEEKAENFAIGNHLRGISNYLLRNYGDIYKRYLVGRRLLNYVEVPETEHVPIKTISLTDRFEMIVSLSKLLERSDDESLDRIMKIADILKESE